MYVEAFEWDDENITHATAHGISVAEIEQAILDADRAGRHPAADRRVFRGHTLGGRHVMVIAQLTGPYRYRPLTAWRTNR